MSKIGGGTEWPHPVGGGPLSLNGEIGRYGRVLWIGRMRWNFCATLIPRRYGRSTGQRTHGKITGPHDPGPDSSCADGNDSLSRCRGACTADFHLDCAGNDPPDFRASRLNDGSRCISAHEPICVLPEISTTRHFDRMALGSRSREPAPQKFWPSRFRNQPAGLFS